MARPEEIAAAIAAGDLYGVLSGAYEDSPADELYEYVTGTPDSPAYVPPGEAVPAYSPGYAADYSAAGGPTDIMVPGVGPVDVIVQSRTNPKLPLSPQQAVMAIVQLVAKNPGILSAIKSAFGAVIRPAPTVNGKQLAGPALWLMFEELPEDARKPMAYYLNGVELPIGLSPKEQEYLLFAVVLDGLEAAGEDMSKLLNKCGCGC